MQEDLTKLVDDLAVRLGRAVLIELPGEPFVASEHLCIVDQARIHALLQKRDSPRLFAQLRPYLDTARTKPVRIPAKPAVEITYPRVVVPIRAFGEFLGWMWLIDAMPELTDAEIALAESACRQAGHAIAEFRRATAGDADWETDAVDALLSGDAERRAEGMQQLSVRGAVGAPYRAVWFQSVDDTVLSASDVSALRQVFRRSPHRLWFGSLEPSGVVSITAHSSQADEITDGLDRADFLRGDGAQEAGIAVGIGSPFISADGVGESVRRARYSANVAAMTGDHSPKSWAELGSLQLFSDVEWGMAGVEAIDADVARLVRDSPVLANTLLTYILHDCNAVRTANALFIHRTTLHYRLDRIRTILGDGWSSPDRRLAMHAALHLGTMLHGAVALEELGPEAIAARG